MRRLSASPPTVGTDLQRLAGEEAIDHSLEEAGPDYVVQRHMLLALDNEIVLELRVALIPDFWLAMREFIAHRINQLSGYV